MIQQHPAYHEGFYDAQSGEPLFDDCPSREYRAGWAAFWECKAILASEIPPARARRCDMNGMDEWQKEYNERLKNVGERLNPLLKVDAIRAADEAACRLDGMFRDLFNDQDRIDLIVTIIRAATASMLSTSLSSHHYPTPEVAGK